MARVFAGISHCAVDIDVEERIAEATYSRVDNGVSQRVPGPGPASPLDYGHRNAHKLGAGSPGFPSG